KANVFFRVVPGGIRPGDLQRLRAHVERPDFRTWQPVRQRDGDASASRTNIDNFSWLPLCDSLDQKFRLRPRDEDARVNGKPQSTKLGFAGDVLQWLAGSAPFDPFAQRFQRRLIQLPLELQVQIQALL